MDVVDSYEQDFIRKAAQLRQKLSIIGGLQGEKKKAAIQEAERLYDETKRTLFNLEQAARSSGNRKYETKVRSCTTELQKLQRDLEHASLISSSYSPKEETYADWQTEQRQRLLVSNSRVDSTGESLVNAHRIAEETVNIGTNVLSELGSQRQQLERARDNLVQIDDNMGRSRKILSVMSRRIATNKMILAFIIVILFAAICFVAYFKWIRKLI